MNNETKRLFKLFNEKFPTAGIGIFQKTVEARLEGLNIDEGFKKLSNETALKLESLYSSLSEDDLRDWVFGLLVQEPRGIIRRALDC